MKLIFKILYQSGYEDTVEQEMTKEDYGEMINHLSSGWTDKLGALLTLGDKKKTGHFIRLDNISRITIEEQ